MADERAIQLALARYVRAAGHPEDMAMGNIFPPEGSVEIFYSNAGAPSFLVNWTGRKLLAQPLPC